MKDFIGNEVAVGDYIFYSTTGRYAESRVGKIVRFTAKSMFIDVVKSNRITYSENNNVRVNNSFVKIDYAPLV